MQIKVGYELIYQCPQPTPMILTLNIHYTRASDITWQVFNDRKGVCGDYALLARRLVILPALETVYYVLGPYFER